MSSFAIVGLPVAMIYLGEVTAKKADDITVFSVIDCQRDPTWIRGHLERAQRTSRSSQSRGRRQLAIALIPDAKVAVRAWK